MMPAETLPGLAEVMPHAPPMLLLSRVLTHEEAETCCAVDIASQRLFRGSDGRVPAWLSIEYMAQCVAAHAGIHAWRAGERPRIGFLVGSRKLTLYRSSFENDEELRVRARHLRGRIGLGALSFACEVESTSGELLAEGNLNIALAGDPSPPQAPSPQGGIGA